MIIGSFIPYKVGEIISGVYERNHDEFHLAVFKVLAPATHTEWKEYRISEGLDLDFEGEDRGYYYRVSTD